MLKQPIFIDQLSKLMSFKTLTGDIETNAKALDYIQSLLSPQAKVKRIKNGQAEILLAANSGKLNPDIGYMVHVDVVAGSDELFTMKQKDNLIYGRGVSDMKFSIPLGIALLNELIEKQSQLSFSLAITTDEEVGGFEGGAFLARELKWRPQALIVPDGGDNLKFVRASKGVAQFKITMLGVSAHASRPWQGENAIPKMARIINLIEQKYGKNNSEESWKTTANFGTLSGGISTNQVCDQVTLQIDFRYPETDSFERISQELNSIVASVDQNNRIETLSTGLPTATDTTLPIVQRFLTAFQNQYGESMAIEPNYGASDARHFAPFNIPILMIKPNGGDIHMESEWLDVDSTMDFYEALRTFLKNSEKEQYE